MPRPEKAFLALNQFTQQWDDKYLQISRSWRDHWNNLNTLFNYPEDIRKAIYTTNIIECSLAASQKWTMPIRNWKMDLNRFMIEFKDRLKDYI